MPDFDPAVAGGNAEIDVLATVLVNAGVGVGVAARVAGAGRASMSGWRVGRGDGASGLVGIVVVLPWGVLGAGT